MLVYFLMKVDVEKNKTCLNNYKKKFVLIVLKQACLRAHPKTLCTNRRVIMYKLPLEKCDSKMFWFITLYISYFDEPSLYPRGH